MSKRKYRAKRPSRELIESVFGLYKPNKVQLFFMSAIGPATCGWLAGNNKRVRELSNILKLSKDEVHQLEFEIYLGFGNGKTK